MCIRDRAYSAVSRLSVPSDTRGLACGVGGSLPYVADPTRKAFTACSFQGVAVETGRLRPAIPYPFLANGQVFGLRGEPVCTHCGRMPEPTRRRRAR
eukprot:11670450-Alexandrium_andersonii.AAC.1